ncbi:oxygen-independent coproporphyrinogen III oxidase [Malaciobacter marinus]|uniref:Coproporphyrinogen III oxidase n=1 Tax=Malaciobacter marinus TaxID=505249 RepID=A0A347TMP6_9BACT|nr:coproporphyrinogen III oxidase family protein [Malaciobacter marinus]AXX87874.1 oxygen-independent coproporphyrinogen III oxidase [Malaciobacter marinus]PHO14323.1 coproporphyrinogen III oxidase [Malaciobacter marinus]
MVNNIKEIFSIFTAKAVVKNTFASCINITSTLKNESKYSSIDSQKKYLLYIHVPFCDNLCPFCTFHKFKHNFEDSNRYFKILREELKVLKRKNVKVDSVYVGGGTPLINEKQLRITIKLVKKLFDVEDISCETDPNHIDVNTVYKLKGLIKRLSIGVQSFDDEILKQLSRYKRFGSSSEIKEKISKIAGILPITNIDLIFNIPSQTQDILRDDLQSAKDLGIEQITTYPLMSSDLNSGFLKSKKINTNEQKFYNIIKEELKDYTKNNMWSFSKNLVDLSDEYVSTHDEYIGVGSGAFSYLDGKLFINAFDLKEYEENIITRKDALMAKSEFENINKIEYAMLSTLFGGKLNIKEFNKLYNVDLEKLLRKELYLVKKLDVIRIEEGIIYPTQFGEYLLVIMMASFYSGMDKVRSMFRR